MLTKDNNQTFCLAVETSGRRGSIAIGKGSSIVAEHKFSGMMRHSAELFATIRKLLGEAGISVSELKTLFITVGPGSFTGLRIAVTLGKMMALANKTKIVPVSTMDVIAANAMGLEGTEKPIKRIASILDAKRSQFYIAVYEKATERWDKILDDCLMSAEDFKEKYANQNSQIWLLGEGLVYYKEKFKADGINLLDEKHWYPSAGKLYEIGSKLAETDNFADAATVKPLYLRQPEAAEKLSSETKSR